MQIVDIVFSVSFIFALAMNVQLIILLFRKSAISIVFFVFGSVLLSFALFLSRVGYEKEVPFNIAYFGLASFLVGIAVIIAIFNLPEFTPFQRFWQRISGLSSGVMISFSLTGVFYPQIMNQIFDVPNSHFTLLLLASPAVLSLVGAFLTLSQLFISNRPLAKKMIFSRWEGLLIAAFVYLLALPFTIVDPEFTLMEKIYLAVLYAIMLVDTYYLFLVGYFVQRFPSQRRFFEYLKDGTFGWFVSRMGNRGPELLSFSPQFAERWNWNMSFLERLSVTLVSFIGMGHEDTHYENLDPTFFSLYQNCTFVGLSIPMKSKVDLEDPRFRGQTLYILTLLIPYEYMLSFNRDGAKQVLIDPKLLNQEAYVTRTCVEVLKRIFE